MYGESQQGKINPLAGELFDKRFGASQEDIDLVVDFARQHDLTVLQTSVSRRSVILMGTVQKFNDAFQVNLADFIPENGITYRGRTGSIHIPENFERYYHRCFWLDNRPQARPMFHLLKNEGGLVHPQATAVSYNPDAVAKSYKYPRDVNGTGECIALIELGGGYRNVDMQNYFSKLGIHTSFNHFAISRWRPECTFHCR
ncbi:MAG: protease pro-enzyme activation domain-containing protein [Puia sp.]